MALEFTNFGLSPEESVKQRQKALDSYSNIAEPAYRSQVARERGGLAEDAYSASAKAAYAGQPTTDITSKAIGMAAEMQPKQNAMQQDMDVKGAAMREDIIGSRQKQAIGNFEQQTGELKDAAARYIAKQAFELGMSSKELAMHRNGTVADIGLENLKKDFEAGRVSEKELRDLSNQLKLQAVRASQALREKEAMLKGQVSAAIAAGNIEAAKARFQVYMDMQKEALRAANEAKATADIFSGAFSVGGAILGGIIGGPAGVAVGSGLGSSVGTLASGAMS